MQVKLKVTRMTFNEDGTITTKLAPELIGGVTGAYASGDLFVTVPSFADQPAELAYGAELNSDLQAFVEIVPEPEEPPIEG